MCKRKTTAEVSDLIQEYMKVLTIYPNQRILIKIVRAKLMFIITSILYYKCIFIAQNISCLLQLYGKKLHFIRSAVVEKTSDMHTYHKRNDQKLNILLLKLLK